MLRPSFHIVRALLKSGHMPINVLLLGSWSPFPIEKSLSVGDIAYGDVGVYKVE